jgi:hypothetical protein
VSENPDVRQSSVPWNYGPDVPYNGHYTVTVTASTDMGTGTAQQQVTANEPFVVNVPPTTPADVTAAPDPKQRVTDLRWSPNPEPDLIGYEVLRAGPSASDPGHVVGGVYTPATSYVDNQVATQPAGTYRYEVVAVRQNGAGNGVVLSGPSPETEVAFSTPPKVSAPPTTTTPAPGTSTSPKSAGTHGGSAGSAQPASGPRSRIVLAPVQSSLPDYQALLNQARATTVTVPPPDPGFSSRLPYQPQVNSKAITLPAIDSPAVLGAPEGGSSGARRTAEFVAAALLLAVLAMFALVLKRSAEQSLALEAVSPDGLPHGLPPEPTLLSPNPPRPEPSPPRPEPALTGRRTRGGSRWSDRVAAVSAGLAAEYTPRGRPAESAERADRAEPLPTSLMLTLRPVAPLPPELAGTPDGAPEP